MPPAPPAAKNQRTSIYGWNKKRSVSPTSQAPSRKMAAPLPPVQRRSDDGYYYEDEYREEILGYMSHMENQSLPQADLMDMQPELQWYMRPYLIDFLVEIHGQFRLRPEVLYLAINIVDRYVSKRVVYKKHYQLVGCAALWIAAKFEDGKDRVPLVRELADMCCKAYDESAFIQMEGHVLSTIGWVIGHPTAEAWLRTYVTFADSTRNEEPRVQHVARFLMETTLFHREFVGIQPSFIAWGALMLARNVCGKARRAAPDSIARYEHVPIRIAEAIDKHFADRLETVSDIVVRKYQPTYFGRASSVVREWYLSNNRFVYMPEPPHTPVSMIAANGLAPSTSWASVSSSSKRSSYASASPSGSFSCASSDDGEPVTPVTPYGSTHSIPDYVNAKENVPPAGQHVALMSKDMPPPHYAPARQALHAVVPQMAELALPNRTLRRLSN
ncbi:hypothetical protein Q5752_004792 [Cryptotrichosporon argae]